MLLWIWRQEDCKFKAILSNFVSLRLVVDYVPTKIPDSIPSTNIYQEEEEDKKEDRDIVGPTASTTNLTSSK